MTSGRRLLIVWCVALAVAVLSGVLLFSSRNSGFPDKERAQTAVTSEHPNSRETAGVTLMPVAEMTRTLGDPDHDVSEDLEIISGIMDEHRRIFGGHPTGENDEITAQLSGRNSKRAAVIDARHPNIRNGQLVDRWGTPYFFHSISASVTEIHSAGPDRTWRTEDDLVWRP